MLKYFFTLLQFSFFMLINTAVFSQTTNEINIHWELIAKLPKPAGSGPSIGFAGMISGVNNNAVIVAGGSNFPNGLPWEGGKKYYSNQIYILEKKDSQFCWNKNVNNVLPEAIAYCATTSAAAGILYAGGENENGISNKAFILKWDEQKNNVLLKPLPNLPLALSNAAATHIGNVVYIAGGDEINESSNSFFSIDLNEQNPQWETLPPLPIALANAVVIAQKNNKEENIYVIGGRTKTLAGISDLHPTVFAFDPTKQVWKKCAAISDGHHITNLSAAAGVALGDHNILILGGDNGIIFHKIETYNAAIKNAKTLTKTRRLTIARNDLTIHHPGFYKGILMYNTLTNTWTKIGELPFPAQVTTQAVKWKNDIIISNGEIKPGVRTPDVWMAEMGK